MVLCLTSLREYTSVVEMMLPIEIPFFVPSQLLAGRFFSKVFGLVV